MLKNEVTKENIHNMVIKFYTVVLKDDLIGPIFISILGDDLKSETWKTHIELLTSFWASIALGEVGYAGSPFAPHIQFSGNLSAEAFQRWLKLFSQTLHSIYEPHIAELFHERGRNIANNFMRNLHIT